MAGAAQGGIAKVKTALELLQKALGELPIGGAEHSDVLKAVSALSKHVGETSTTGQASQQDVVQQLAALARQQQQGGPSPLAGMMPGGPGGPGAGGPPSPPPPAGAM
jgi:hypothetical protein